MINLTQKFEYEIRGKKYTAYSLSLNQQSEIEDMLSKVNEKSTSKELGEVYTDIALFILKQYNDTITREEIKNNFPLSAILRILADVSGQSEISKIKGE